MNSVTKFVSDKVHDLKNKGMSVVEISKKLEISRLRIKDILNTKGSEDAQSKTGEAENNIIEALSKLQQKIRELRIDLRDDTQMKIKSRSEEVKEQMQEDVITYLNPLLDRDYKLSQDNIDDLCQIIVDNFKKLDLNGVKEIDLGV